MTAFQMNYERMVSRIDAVIRVLLYIMIFWLPYSKAVVEVTVSMAGILWILKNLMKACSQHHLKSPVGGSPLQKWLQAFFLPQTCLNRPIAFFLWMCILSLVSSGVFYKYLPHFFSKTLEWFVVYFLFVDTIRTKKHLAIAFGVFLFTASATALDAILQFYVTKVDIFRGHAIRDTGRATAGFDQPNNLAAFLIVAIPLALAHLTQKGKPRWYYFLFVVVNLTSFTALLLTFSRGAFISLILGLAFFFFVFQRQWFRFFMKTVIIFSILAAVLIFYFSPHFIQNFRLDPMSLKLATSWRSAVWEMSLQIASQRPLVGHGLNTFMAVFEQNLYKMSHPLSASGFSATYAHNCFIQMLVEVGFLGLLGFLWILFELFKELKETWEISFTDLRLYNQKMIILGMTASLLSFLAHSFVDTHFYSLQLVILFWMMVGLAIPACASVKHNES